MSLRILAVLITFLLIFFNNTALLGAKAGFLLWYDTLFPTLLPFMIISQVILEFNIFEVKPNAGYVVLYPLTIGIFCGCPLGPMLLLKLFNQKKISKNVLEIMTPLCTCLSPAYLIGVVGNRLSFVISGFPKFAVFLFSLLALLPAIFIICLTCKLRTRKNSININNINNKPLMRTEEIIAGIKENTENSSISRRLTVIFEKSINASLMLCLYIMIFSVINEFVKSFLPLSISSLIACALEVSSGLQLLSLSTYSSTAKLILSIFFSTFAGVSCMFQAYIMTDGKMSIKKYICIKTAMGLFASTLAFFFCICIS